LRGGEVIELAGDIGGGKTTFVRGLARGAGSSDVVSSPTFTISKVYKVSKHPQLFHEDAAQGAGEERKGGVHNSTSTAPRSQKHSAAPQVLEESSASADEQSSTVKELWHLDFYRLSEGGLMKYDLHDLLKDPKIVVVVEWANVVHGVLPTSRLIIKFKTTDLSSRQLILSGPKRLEYLLEGVK